MRFVLEFKEFNNPFQFGYDEVEEIKEIISDFLQAGIEGEMPVISTGELDLILDHESKIKFEEDDDEYQAVAIHPSFLFSEEGRADRFSINDFNNLDTKQLESILSNNINDVIIIRNNLEILIAKKSYYNYLKRILSIESIMDSVEEEIIFERVIWDDTLGIDSYGGARGVIMFLITKKDMTDVPLEISFKPIDPLISDCITDIDFKISAGIQKKYVVGKTHLTYMEKIVETINNKKLEINIGIGDSDDDIVEQFADMIEDNIFSLLEDENVKNYKHLLTTFDELKEKYNIDVEYDGKFIPKEINNVYFTYKGKQVEFGIILRKTSALSDNIEIYSSKRKIVKTTTIDNFSETIFLMMMDKLEESINFEEEDIKDVYESLIDYFYAEFDEQPKLIPCELKVIGTYVDGKTIKTDNINKLKEWTDPEVNSMFIARADNSPQKGNGCSLILTDEQINKINSLISGYGYVCKLNKPPHSTISSAYIVKKKIWKGIMRSASLPKDYEYRQEFNRESMRRHEKIKASLVKSDAASKKRLLENFEFNEWDSEDGKEVIQVVKDYFQVELDEQPILIPCKVVTRDSTTRAFFSSDGQGYKWHDPEVNAVYIRDPSYPGSGVSPLKLTYPQYKKLNSLIREYGYTYVEVRYLNPSQDFAPSFIINTEFWKEMKATGNPFTKRW